jgi:hypothetical protein
LRNYRLEFIDLSGREPAEIVEKATAAVDLLDECSAKGWVVVSFVPFKSEAENQYVALLSRVL